MNACTLDPYWILAFYHFTPIEDPKKEVLLHKKFFKDLDISCRIYISEQGINSQMCALKEHAKLYMEWMESRPEFAGIHYKIDPYHEHAFPKKTVKYRKKLVAIDEKIDFSNKGVLLPPEKWKEMLEQKELSKILLDVRNHYEWKVGHFEGATLPPCDTFREFKDFAKELAKDPESKKKPVMMYCTGGIRCELYSSILKDQGFDEVYQLEGGVINYGHRVGNAGWLGKLFVFDDRLTASVGKEASAVIGTCYFCQAPIESYYNCANTDCNHLYLCCPSCLHDFQGCCSRECQNAPRVRPYYQQNPHKPFRKWNHYTKTKEEFQDLLKNTEFDKKS